jgi:hypothetical protein
MQLLNRTLLIKSEKKAPFEVKKKGAFFVCAQSPPASGSSSVSLPAGDNFGQTLTLLRLPPPGFKEFP